MEDATNGHEHLIQSFSREAEERAQDLEKLHQTKNQEIRVEADKRRLIEKDLNAL